MVILHESKTSNFWVVSTRGQPNIINSMSVKKALKSTAIPSASCERKVAKPHILLFLWPVYSVGLTWQETRTLALLEVRHVTTESDEGDSFNNHLLNIQKKSSGKRNCDTKLPDRVMRR